MSSYQFNPLTGEFELASTSGGGGSSVWGSISGTLSDQTDLSTALSAKVDKITGYGLSKNDFSDVYLNKLTFIQDFATANYPNDYLMSRANQTGVQPHTTISDWDSATYSAISAQYGVNGGIAQLDGSTKLAKTYTYPVIKQSSSIGLFPVTGETDTIYIDTSTQYPYYWDSTSSSYKFAGKLISNLDDIGDGTTNKLFTEQRVRDTVLTGLSTSTNAAITASDSIVGSLGKLQAQFNASQAVIPSGTKSTMFATTGTFEGQLYFCTTYNQTFVWNTDRWEPYGIINPRYGFHIYDEFMNGATGTGTAGDLGWNIGGTFTALTTADQYTQGVMILRQASAGVRSFASLQANGVTLNSNLDYFIESRVLVPTLATGTEDYNMVACGLGNTTNYSATMAMSDGAFIGYYRGSGGNFWRCVTANAATQTVTTSTQAVNANSWIRLRIVINGNSSVDFYVGNALVATHTTNIPSGRTTGYILKVDKILGTSNADLYIDYMRSYGFFVGGGR